MYEIEEIRELLKDLSEVKYAEFASKLIPGENKLLGVRLFKLRKVAKIIVDHDPEKFLSIRQFQSFEEKMLHGMVIGLLNTYKQYDFNQQENHIKLFLPYIDNWSICDSFCSGLKIARTHKDEMWQLICYYLETEETYQIRFGLVMMLLYYIEDDYYQKILTIIEGLKTEHYYVKMAAAWTISTIYVKYPTETVGFLRLRNLDKDIYKKTLQKICESKKILPEQKKDVIEMKKVK